MTLALRTLCARGSALAGYNAFLSIGNARHVAPLTMNQGVGAVFTVPVTLRIILSPIQAPEDYTETLSNQVRY